MTHGTNHSTMETAQKLLSCLPVENGPTRLCGQRVESFRQFCHANKCDHIDKHYLDDIESEKACCYKIIAQSSFQFRNDTLSSEFK